MSSVRKGFTLIELMTVVAIIGLLVSIVMTATAGAMKYSRNNRAEAIFKCVKEGYETYHFQNDQWPTAIDDKVSEQANAGNNNAGIDGRRDRNKVVLTGDEIKRSMYEIVEESIKKRNPLMDVSGLFVSRQPGESRREHAFGLGFRDAVHRHWRVSQMYYGYPDPETGNFLRFDVIFAAGSVQVKGR